MKLTLSLAAAIVYAAVAVAENCKAGRWYCGHHLRELDGEYSAIYVQAGRTADSKRATLEYTLFQCAFDTKEYAGYIKAVGTTCEEDKCIKGDAESNDYCG
ncbi:hypothetical protein B0H13DRAFT_1851872 [Mycena leptocephala]|nr:hypothetical protein B0H13DRAFT_1851872 [Mycena leptocephala]